MGYLDTTDAEMFALTRERRQEARARRDTARLAHEALAFPIVQHAVQEVIEAGWRTEDEDWGRHPAHVQWKRDQWEAGNRRCGYCTVAMTRKPNQRRTCTVDHRKPRAFGGRDEEANWLLACLACNQRKGTMSESMFRALLRAEGVGRLTA